MKISIITLCYNQLKSATKPFVESLYQNTDENSFEFIIINNNSSDGTYEYLEDLKTTKNNVTVVQNKENGGFATGVNQGLKIAKGDYIIVSNNDCLFTPNWANKLIYCMNTDDRIGLLTPLTNHANRKYQRTPNPDAYTPQNYIELYQKDIAQNPEVYYADMVAFFCFIVKKEVIKKVGYLDENFGLAWYEDDDYCIRLRKAGYKLGVALNCYVFHNHSVTTGVLKKTKEGEKLFERNKRYFLFKHFPFRTICQDIFSVKNSYHDNKKHKVITIFGIKIKIRCGCKPETLAHVERERERERERVIRLTAYRRDRLAKVA